MAAFSYQLQHQSPFLLDSVFMPSSDPIKMCGFLEEPNNNSSVVQCFSQFYQPESMSHIPANVSVHESSICCLDDQTTKVMTLSNNETSVTDKSRSRSSSILDMDSSSVTHKLDKKRKTREGSSNSMTSAHSKNIVRDGGQGKKQRKSINNVQKDGKEKKGKDENSNKKDEIIKGVDHQEAPTGYIHVRARRGQATDSHSLAERVRREKISERMKLLQALVPGCDKVTGKALMLDEIINYVQSLQNQVEFLSMKLASLNPMYYDFGMELDALMVRHDQSLSGLGTTVPNMEQASPTNNNTTPQAASVVIPNTNSTGYPLMDGSASLMFQQAHFQNSISQGNDGQLFWGADDQRQNYINNQSGFSNNLCSFH